MGLGRSDGGLLGARLSGLGAEFVIPPALGRSRDAALMPVKAPG
jgi:hypothetical protein